VRTRDVRAAAWFERYAWFVSSENCLVLSARDGQQADLLLKRHMRCKPYCTCICIWRTSTSSKSSQERHIRSQGGGGVCKNLVHT
jgi:hypothetical protein